MRTTGGTRPGGTVPGGPPREGTPPEGTFLAFIFSRLRSVPSQPVSGVSPSSPSQECPLPARLRSVPSQPVSRVSPPSSLIRSELLCVYRQNTSSRYVVIRNGHFYGLIL